MSPIVEVDPGELARAYGADPLLVRHALADHPLLSLPAVVDAAGRIRGSLVEHNFGRVPTVLVAAAPRLDAEPREIARDIERNGCWMVLRWIHELPEYAALRDEVLDCVAGLLPGEPLGRREAYLFLSGPDTVTPTHFDSEHNILLQVRGAKTFHIGHHPDDATRERQLEQYHRRQTRNLPYLPGAERVVDLGPGTGLYVPPNAPHWVGNGPEVSISFSVVWHPPTLDRAGRVHFFNHSVRALGRTPRPPGRSRLADGIKSGAVRGYLALRRGLAALRFHRAR